MNNEDLIPWYAVEKDTERQQIYNRPQSAVYIYEPPPAPKADSTPVTNYRPADVVMMELTVKIRKDLENQVVFEWPDDFYRDLCVSWYEEQKRQGIKDIAYLCGDKAAKVSGRFIDFCIACWYADGSMACHIPNQKMVDNVVKPFIEQIKARESLPQKPIFPDNAEEFKKALSAIADYTDFEWWKNCFKQGLDIMEQENIEYNGQENTFPMPKPYFKYLLAAQSTRLSAGMGSWYDLPTAGTISHKYYTELFTAERDAALMYAINNC